jgi:hypothetical protein
VRFLGVDFGTSFSLTAVLADDGQAGSEPRLVSSGEADFLAVQVPFEDRVLMSQRQDLSVFVPVGRLRLAWQRDGVAHPR